jgi:hypothetical protein
MLRPPYGLLLTRAAKRCYSSKRRFNPVKLVQYDAETGIKELEADAPARFNKAFRDYPAIARWFIRPQPDDVKPEDAKLNTSHLNLFGASTVSLELTSTARDGTPTFERFEAPLSLLISHMTGPQVPESGLYLAQHSLADLPPGIQADLPTPAVLNHLGKGDIYASSLWMGRPPTRTPLHRDPNPNLLIQLSGKKIVRLMKPEVGRQVYERVRGKLGRAGGRASMRGDEMMRGKELAALENAVWDDLRTDYADAKGLEVTLGSGDGLYIPLGWWHAVHGIGRAPNVSVSCSRVARC